MTAVPLSDDQVREVMRLYCQEHRTLVEIARLFGRSPNTISGIVRGRTYRHVTEGYHDPRKCMCLKCLKARREEENAARGRAADAVGVCVACGGEAAAKVWKLLRHPSRTRCADCLGSR